MILEVIKNAAVTIRRQLQPFGTVVIFAGATYSVKILYTIVWWMLLKKHMLKIKRPMPDVQDPDMIYLCVFPCEYTRQVPNLSPFGVKLETWLRMHNIRYQLVETRKRSIRSTIPYIIMNGEEYSDTNIIIEHLSQKYGIDPQEGLSEVEVAVRRAFLKMLEENTSWTYFLLRYCRNTDKFKKVCKLCSNSYFNNALFNLLANQVNKRALGHGIGRFSDDELARIGNEDLMAISTYLGDSQFFFGDKPTMIDCSLFGHLCQIAYVVDFPYPHRAVLSGKGANLMRYLDRVKDRLWEDWDERVNPAPFEVEDL